METHYAEWKEGKEAAMDKARSRIKKTKAAEWKEGKEAAEVARSDSKTVRDKAIADSRNTRDAAIRNPRSQRTDIVLAARRTRNAGKETLEADIQKERDRLGKAKAHGKAVQRTATALREMGRASRDSTAKKGEMYIEIPTPRHVVTYAAQPSLTPSTGRSSSSSKRFTFQTSPCMSSHKMRRTATVKSPSERFRD